MLRIPGSITIERSDSRRPAVGKPVSAFSPCDKSARVRISKTSGQSLGPGSCVACLRNGVGPATNGTPWGSLGRVPCIARHPRESCTRRTPGRVGSRARPHALLNRRGFRSVSIFAVDKPNRGLASAMSDISLELANRGSSVEKNGPCLLHFFIKKIAKPTAVSLSSLSHRL